MIKKFIVFSSLVISGSAFGARTFDIQVVNPEWADNTNNHKVQDFFTKKNTTKELEFKKPEFENIYFIENSSVFNELQERQPNIEDNVFENLDKNDQSEVAKNFIDSMCRLNQGFLGVTVTKGTEETEVVSGIFANMADPIVVFAKYSKTEQDQLLEKVFDNNKHHRYYKKASAWYIPQITAFAGVVGLTYLFQSYGILPIPPIKK